MSKSRNHLKWFWRQYISATFTDIRTVTDFINGSWIKDREEESKKMRKVEKATEGGYRDEAGLKEGLEPTLKGLNEMQIFLEAVEKLAVTSAHVFDQSLVVQLCEETDLESMKMIISVSQLICPLLITLKGDYADFFSPKLENMEVMQLRLEQYISNIKDICGIFRQGSTTALGLDSTSVDVDLSNVFDEEIEEMLLHMKVLQEIREDKPFRMAFLFQDKYEPFMEMFRERKERMLQFLEDLEACAVTLDDMTKGARISNVAGSSLGMVGGILSIVGLALTPVTFGVSMGLTVAGVGLGGISGVNSVVTTITEKGVNSVQKKKAEKTFEKFMEDMKSLQMCLNDVIKQHFENIQESSTAQCLNIASNCASALKGGNVFVKGTEAGLAAAKGAAAIGKAARGTFFAVNALFIGVDAFLIVNNSIDLYKNTPNIVSKFIKASAALWRSEVNSMQKIYDSLEEVEENEHKKQQLQRPFYEGRARV
ncbi:uncharacterized protein LOC117393697 isoform X3 [Periophthalmus magnuspinnatus]|uniref:uncharacterized protein LOC117393697 isoform X3 n=1 Tax=Periophthalmus magnuspinnatus TaxID=409849 RepID=UPI00145BAB3E|nr:uncharacterized protein LOC117393697 isoform X3 [Periophthalmus magnuspinnatus]